MTKTRLNLSKRPNNGAGAELTRRILRGQERTARKRSRREEGKQPNEQQAA